MQYVFYDLDETERELVTNVLDKWCIPWKSTTHRRDGLFGSSCLYDISIDVRPEKIDWVKKKVEERFNLENSFDMKCVEHPTTLEQKPDKEVPSLFEDLFKPTFTVDTKTPDEQKQEVLEQAKKKSKCLIAQIDELFETHIKPNVDKINGDKNKLIDFMSENGLMDRLKDAIKDSLLYPQDIIKQDLEKYFNNKMSEMVNIGGMFEEISKTGKELSFDELPEQMKVDLENEFGRKVLTSDRCKFFKTENGIAVFVDQSE